MRLVLSFMFFAFISSISAHEQEENGCYHYTINERRYLFSKGFILEKNFHPFGIIKKSKFHITSVYDLYGKTGLFEARGSARMLCLGLFYDRATEIDIYDEDGHYLGLIDGQIVTTAKARFSFYNAQGTLTGIAYVDLSGSGVLISHPLYDTYGLMSMERKFVPNVQDYWAVSVYDPQQIDARVLKIFSAFIVDRQNSWHKDD